MNSAVKIIKRGKSGILSEARAGQEETTSPQRAREMMRTVKGWIAELHQRRRDEQIASSAFRKYE